MNELKVFESMEFGNVRAEVVNGKEMFVASDIAKSLGYSNTSKAINDHCRSITKRYIPHPQSKSKMIEANFITEGDLYRLIAHSKLPSAEKFESWVFNEVLPTIRKTGGYVNNTDLMINTYFGACDDTSKTLVKGLLVNIEEQQKQIITISNERDTYKGEVVQFLDTENLLSWDTIAKNLKIGKNTMLETLRDMKILQTDEYEYNGKKYRGESHNVPYQAYMKYFDVKYSVKGGKRYPKVLVTAKGQEYLYKKLVKEAA